MSIGDGESDLTCVICMESYDEELHAPRTLRCGHTLCTPCLSSLLNYEPAKRTCPECRYPIKITSASHLAISWAVLRLSRALETARVGENGKIMHDTCKDHSKPIVQQCSVSQKWLCNLCFCHNACTNLRTVPEALGKLKQKQVDDTELKVENLTKASEKLNKCKAELTTELHNLEKSLDKCRAVISNVEESEARIVQASTATIYDRAFTSHSKNLNDATQFLSSLKTISGITHTQSSNGTVISSSDVITPYTPSPSPPLIAYISIGMLKEKVQSVKSIYAEFEKNGMKKYGRIEINGSDICMYSLSAKYPTQHNALFISFGVLMNTWEGQVQQKTFFDLNIGDRNEGRIEILLFNKTPRAEAFASLCSGQNNYSYEYHRINFVGGEYSDQVQMMVGQEFVTDNSRIHPAVDSFSRQMRDGAIYRRSIFPGLVAGAPVSDRGSRATFRVHMFHSKGKSDFCGFGKVEKGLGLIKYALSEENTKQSYIQKCGLIFKC